MELAALAYEVRCCLGQPLCKYEHTSGIIHLNLWFISGHAAVFQMTHVKTVNGQRHAWVSSVIQSENSQCHAFCLPFDWFTDISLIFASKIKIFYSYFLVLLCTFTFLNQFPRCLMLLEIWIKATYEMLKLRLCHGRSRAVLSFYQTPLAWLCARLLYLLMW